MARKHLTDIPKEKFEKVYLNNTVNKTAKIFKIAKGSVSKLALIYNLSKINVMR